MFRLGRRARNDNRDDGLELQPRKPIRGAWYADPYGLGAERWWDGHAWTREVRGTPVRVDAPRRRIPARESDVADSESDTRNRVRSRLCPHCRGTGQHLSINGECKVCLGTGRVANKRRWTYVLLVAALFTTALVAMVVVWGPRYY